MLIWIVFIGIAIISYLVQANLKSKFEKIFPDAVDQWHDRKGSGRKDAA